MFKKIVACLSLMAALFLGGLSAAGQASEINWKSYDEGMEASKKLNRRVFLHFRTEWCGYCKKMDALTFSDERVIDFMNNHFVAVRVDGDREESIRNAHEVRGYPDNRFLDNNRKEVHRTPGFVNAETFLFFLEYIQTGSYKTMNPMEYYKSR